MSYCLCKSRVKLYVYVTITHDNSSYAGYDTDNEVEIRVSSNLEGDPAFL